MNNDYSFQDGVYLSFEEFHGDSPSYKGSEMKIIRVDSADYHLKNIRKIKVKNEKGKFKNISLKQVWGLCYMGRPYINYRGGVLEPGSNRGDRSILNAPFSGLSVTFARLDVIGRLCVFTLEGEQEVFSTNTMVTHTFPRKNVLVRNMILDIETGYVYDCNFHVVKEYIKGDEQLLRAMEQYSYTINLVDVIITFNNRNPVYPSPVSIEYPVDRDEKDKKKKENEYRDLEIIENF